MKEHLKITGSTINKLQILIGVAGLLVGTFVYLIDRSPDQTYFIYKSGLDISLYKILPSFFGPVGNSLPAFIHVFSFILITAGLFACKNRSCLIICISWFVIDIAFEFGQKFKKLSMIIIPDWFAGIPCLENFENYFLQGTFDCFDLAAITLATIVAYPVLFLTKKESPPCQN